MPFIAANYKNHPNAPEGQWVCSRTSNLGPYASHPPAHTRSNPNYCGQCVSFVTTVCENIPVSTTQWVRGGRVRGNTTIKEGTAIATFNAKGQYHGHAAIYVSQDEDGIHVHDQWITGAGKGVGPRLIRWGGNGVSNDGDGFYVVEF